MHAIIPVAGMGTRLRPITHTTPKALIPVAGRPVLGHIIDRLIPAGVDRLTLVVGHLGDAIVSWVRSEFPLDVGFVRQESMDGLASAVALAAPRVDDGPTMVVLGDTLAQISSEFGVSVDQLVAFNGIEDRNLIFAGSALRIPYSEIPYAAGLTGRDRTPRRRSPGSTRRRP